MPKLKVILLILAALAAVVTVLVAISPPAPDQAKSARENAKALIGGPFSLTNHHGEKVTEQDFHGKYMLIYFGYTYCPDVCPMELQIMADALDRLAPETLADITPVFISVDPDRDSVEVLAQYAPAFHPQMIGLTGSKEQIAAVKKAYRVYSAKEKPEADAEADSYLVSHTSYTYLMDRNGDYVTHFRSQTDPEAMAARLRELVQ